MMPQENETYKDGGRVFQAEATEKTKKAKKIGVTGGTTREQDSN